MLLFGNSDSNKTKILIEKYASLLNSGADSNSILVIVQNSKMKNEFIEGVKKLLKVEAISKFHIYSYFGLCYNMILENYPVAENMINSKARSITPYLCGLEVSQYIFRNTIDKYIFKGYNSKKNLLHQLFRRHSLITLNALSESEIKQRAKILHESFSEEINWAINSYKKQTLDLRAFDYLRQVNLFSFLYRNIENKYKYVFVDDADEITPSLFEYLKFLKEKGAEFFIAYDKKGTSRMGHLCAAENDFEALLNEKGQEINIEGEKNKTADLIFDNIMNNKPIELNNLITKDFIRCDLMFDFVIDKVNSLIQKGIKPSDILIVTPNDELISRHYLEKINSKVYFLSGSEKIESNKTIGGLISILKLINEGDNFKISPYKLKGVLGGILSLDMNLVLKICQKYEASLGLMSLDGILQNENDEKIQKYLTLKEKIKSHKLSEQLYSLADEFVKGEDIKKVNKLLKQIRDFENVFKNNFSISNLIYQLENTIISENPLEDENIENDGVITATLNRAIDLKIKNKYLFLISCTDSNWIRQDIGPLYNAWVFQKNRIKKDFTLEDNIYYQNNKTARTLRKLYLLNSGEIYLLSSVYDFNLRENFKGIKHLFKAEEIKSKDIKLTPREDQKAVLEYKGGHLAIMAVAGAGKTTILLMLVLKLLNEGVKPENIFVLTYMDSAARTFKERIKNIYPDCQTPNIMTLHALAMRILKENNNHAHLGLDVDFDIADEIKRTKIINEILYNEGIEIINTPLYKQAISLYKNTKNRAKDFIKEPFKRIFLKYNRMLREENLIDYDDLLILALELLKQNSNIREYYQNLAQFVIEDEAQDSSAIQQELINIISKKYDNIIRTGDINQAITGTFTNSDVEGFRKFIENNPSVKMNYSARNSTGIIDFANNTIKRGLKISPNSFYDIETMPIEGKNIKDKNSVIKNIFENEEDELNFIKNQTNEILSKDKNCTIGILLRTNSRVDYYCEYFKSRGYKVINQNGLISSNPVFKCILAVFNFISSPMNNNTVIDFITTMHDSGKYKDEYELIEKVKNLSTPFILENFEDYAIWWDLRYFLELTLLNPILTAFKIANFYFSADKENKANIAPVVSFISKIYNSQENFEDTVEKLNNISKNTALAGINLYEEEKKGNGQICIMTLHKSKGAEFDYVFMSELTEKNMGFKLEDIKIKDNYKILKNITNQKKEDDIIKSQIRDENLRLFYVGVTRAKKKLYLSASKKYKVFNKIKEEKISKCMEF